MAACNVDNPMPLTYKTNGDDLGMVNICKGWIPHQLTHPHPTAQKPGETGPHPRHALGCSALSWKRSTSFPGGAPWFTNCPGDGWPRRVYASVCVLHIHTVYIYIYLYIYIFIFYTCILYKCVCTWIATYIYIYICVVVCMHECMDAYKYTYMCVCVRICVYYV